MKYANSTRTKGKVTIKIDDKTIRRKVNLESFGNFVMAIVRYKNENYLLNEWVGDEYLRDDDVTKKVYTLGRKLGR